MTKAKAKKTGHSKRFPHAFQKPVTRLKVLGAVFTASILISTASFVSLPLGLLCLGVLSLLAMIYSEYAGRRYWEKAASFKMQRLEKGQTETQTALSAHESALTELKDKMSGLQASMRALRSPSVSSVPPPAASTDPSFAESENRGLSHVNTLKNLASMRYKETMTSNPPSHHHSDMPRALKPGQTMDAEEEFGATSTQADLPEEIAEMSDLLVKELLSHALDHKRIDVFVQPIMRLPQRQTRFYELFARIRAKPGLYMPASRYMPVAEQDNMNKQIDDLLLLHSLKTIEESAHVARAAPFFINITRNTLRNGSFMKRLLSFLSSKRHLAPRLIFEIAQSDFEDMAPPLLEVLRGLGTLGCSLSLDHVTHVDMDIATLQRYKVRFIKLDAQMLLKASPDDKHFASMHKAKRQLEANGVGVIIEKIESEAQMRELLEFDPHYGQGYLLGRPDLEGAYKNRKPVADGRSGARRA